VTPARTALHESGHCVAAAALGVEVERTMLHAEGGGTTVLRATDPRRDLLITVAGDAAEKVCTPPDGALAWLL
jgi:hypothetical protein